MSHAIYSRREFGKVMLAGLPLSLMLRAEINSKFKGVQIGAQTYSFRSIPATEIIPAMVKPRKTSSETRRSLGGGAIDPSLRPAAQQAQYAPYTTGSPWDNTASVGTLPACLGALQRTTRSSG